MKVWQHDQFELQPGQSLDRALDNYLGRTIRIDNLSNSWLFVESSAQRYVRPNTTGWWALLVPAQTVIKVRAVAAPAGGIQSQNTGGPVLIDVYEDQLGFGGDADGTLIQSQVIATEKDSFSVGLTSSATPYTHVNTLILPQPGLGLRYRIFSVGVRHSGGTNTLFNAGVAGAFIGGVSPAPNEALALVSLSSQKHADYAFMGDVGLACPDNAELILRQISETASVPMVAMTIFTTEEAL